LDQIYINPGPGVVVFSLSLAFLFGEYSLHILSVRVYHAVVLNRDTLYRVLLTRDQKEFLLQGFFFAPVPGDKVFTRLQAQRKADNGKLFSVYYRDQYRFPLKEKMRRLVRSVEFDYRDATRYQGLSGGGDQYAGRKNECRDQQELEACTHGLAD